jgi:hypothetical protein
MFVEPEVDCLQTRKVPEKCQRVLSGVNTTKNITVLAQFFGMSAPNCPCPKRDCERHSDCEACVKHHKEKDELPYCAR